MNQETKKLEEIKEKYENIIFDEVKYGIFTALVLYKSLNLKKLAQLVGRPETTTIRYVKQLLSDGLIDVDTVKTATSWGKFYCLSKEAKVLSEIFTKQLLDREKRVFTQLMALRGKSEEEIQKAYVKEILSKKDFKTKSIKLRSMLAFKHNVENLIVNEFQSGLEELQKLLSTKGQDYIEENIILKPSDIILSSYSIPLTKGSHLLKIYELFLRLQLDLLKLKEEFEKEMDKENIPAEKRRIMNVHLFFGTMDFDFTLKDKE